MPSRCSRPLPIGAMPAPVRAGRLPSCQTMQPQFARDTLLRKGPVGAAPGAWARMNRKISDANATGDTSAEVEKTAQLDVSTSSSMEVLEDVASLKKYDKVGHSARMKNFEGSSRNTSPGCSTTSAEVFSEIEKTAQIDIYTPSSAEVLDEVSCLDKCVEVGLLARMKNFKGSSRSTSPGCSTTSGEVFSEVEKTAQIDIYTPSSMEVLDEVARLDKSVEAGLSAKMRNLEGSSRSTSPGCSTNTPSSPTFSYAKALDLEPMYLLEPLYVRWENTCIFDSVKRVKMPELALDAQCPAFVQLVGTTQISQDFDVTLPPNVFYDSTGHAARTRTLPNTSTPNQLPCDAGLASVGSMHHFKGICKPCAFVHTYGCVNGDRCSHCHLCPPGEKLRRRRNWRLAAKQLQQ